MSRFYIFGFTWAAADPCPDVDGNSVSLHRVDAVAAIVKALGDGHADVPQLLLSHHRVLAAMLERGPVIPLQPGLVLTSVQDITDLVTQEHRRIERLLHEFRDRVEANVKVYYDEKAILGEIAAEQPQLARAGRDYHSQMQAGRQVAELLERRRAHDSQELLGLLCQHAERVAVHTATEFTALNASFLLAPAAASGFEAALAQWSEAQGRQLRVKCIAPLPPYSFVAS